MLSQRLKLVKKTGNSHYSLWVLNSIIYHYISRLGRQWLISLYFSFGSLVAYKMLKIFKTPRFQAQCKAGPGSPPHFCIKPCLRVLNPIPIASLSLSTYWKLNNPIFIVRKLCVADFSKSFNLLRIRKVILEKTQATVYFLNTVYMLLQPFAFRQ